MGWFNKAKSTAQFATSLGTEFIPGIEVVRAVKRGEGFSGIAQAVAMEAVFMVPGVGQAGRVAKAGIKVAKISRNTRKLAKAKKGTKVAKFGALARAGKKGTKKARRSRGQSTGAKGVKKPNRFGSVAGAASGLMGGGGVGVASGGGSFKQPRGRVSKRFVITDTVTGETKPYVSKPRATRKRRYTRRSGNGGMSQNAIIKALIAKS